MIKWYIVKKSIGNHSGRVFSQKEVGELVRCKDCKYKEHCFSMVHMCEENQRFSVNRDIDFCSYGERKEQKHD